MLCMLFNVYINTIRYVLLISSFCRWGKQCTEKPSNLLLVTYQPEKLGFKPCSLATEPQLPMSHAVSWQMAAAHEELTLTKGEMTVETHVCHKYTCIHRYTHPVTLHLKD